MAEVTGIVVSGTERARRALDGVRFWNVMERIIPRALAPVAHAARANAPKGKTGKLTQSPFEIRTRRKFALGTVLDVAIGTLVPYGHLVEAGHRIVARGPTRKGKRLSRQTRKALKVGLENRRAVSQGMVPGRRFAQRAMEAREGQVKDLIEKLLGQELMRAL